MIIYTPLFRLLFIGLIFCLFSCNQQADKTNTLFFTPKVVEVHGYIVPKDSVALPKVIPVGKFRTVSADKPRVAITQTNVHPVGKPKVIVAGVPTVCTFGQDSFSLPQTVPAISKPTIAGAPEVVVAKEAFSKDQNPHSFSSFGQLQGLKHHVIYYMLEDSHGNFWFANEGGGGVTKYDGKYFSYFTEKQGFISKSVESIMEDKQGNLWFVAKHDGVTKYDGKTFTHFTEKEGLVNNKVRGIFEDKNGNIWFGTEGGVSKYDGQSFTQFTKKQGLYQTTVCYIWCMLEDKNGHIWFCTRGDGVAKYDGKSFTHFTEKEGLINNNVWSILEDKKGDLWFGTNNGVSQYDGKTFTQFTEKEGLSNNTVTAIVEDKNSTLWFGTASGGLNQYDGKSFTYFTKNEGLSDNKITHIIVDKYGTLWVSTYGGGVNKYDGNVFTHFTEKEGLINNNVLSILEDKKGTLWFCTAAGVSTYQIAESAQNGIFTHFIQNKGLYANWFSTSLEDKNGNIWFDNDGLNQYTPNKEGIGGTFTQITEKDQLQYTGVKASMEDKNGNLWFGTEGAGVIKYVPKQENRGGTFTYFTEKEGLLSNYSSAILEDKKGNIWFGTEGAGVSKYTPNPDGVGGVFTQFTEKEGFINNWIWDMKEDKQGNIWFGTKGGVSKYTVTENGIGETFTHFTEKEGLCNNAVRAILNTKNGDMWFGTASGLSLLAKDYDKLLTIRYKNVQNHEGYDKTPILFKNFTYENGFLGIGCNKKTLCEDKNGTIWIGANDRLTALNPKEIIRDTSAPNIQLIGLTLFNENIAWQNLNNKKDTTLVLGNGVNLHDCHFDSLSRWYGLPEQLSLAYNNNYLTFNFVGITTHAPQKVKYQYKLEEIDKNWNIPTFSTEAHYGNLPHGTYTFKVKAMNSEGYWSKELSYTFTIRPPWWRTWFAYLLYATLISGSIVFFYRFQLKRQLEQAEALRLKELDTVKTKLYTNITHEFRTPLTVILGMAQQILDKPKEYFEDSLKMIIRNGQNLLNLVNQMLDLSKLENGKLSLNYQQGDVVNFLKYLVESFHSFGENKGVQIHFLTDLDAFTMDFDETRLQQVVANLLSNAIKFTPKGGNIYVSISTQNKAFLFKIKDTGIGISEQQLPYIFDRFYQADDTTTRHGEGTGIGLSLTRELVKLMEGTITVKSQLGKGTEFVLTLPIQQVSAIKTDNNKAFQTGMKTVKKVVSLDENPFSIDNKNTTTVRSDSYIEKPLVLIADDNADVRAYIASCLATDYHLEVAKNGQECEDIAFETTPDLIVLDVMMPLKDGFEVCKTLKSDERTSHIPIILLTAKADIDSKLQGLERGAEAYLMKPFNKEELSMRIKKLLELRQQLQQYYLSSVLREGIEKQNLDVKKPQSEGVPLKNTDLSRNYREGGNNHTENMLTNAINGLDNAFVLKVKAIIEVHVSEQDFGVEKLSRALALSPSQVLRKLLALTGLTTNGFILYVRLVKAKELLQSSGYSISAIAYDSGFSDPAYFSRVFKQEFGISPQAWREENLSE